MKMLIKKSQMSAEKEKKEEILTNKVIELNEDIEEDSKAMYEAIMFKIDQIFSDPEKFDQESKKLKNLHYKVFCNL